MSVSSLVVFPPTFKTDKHPKPLAFMILSGRVERREYFLPNFAEYNGQYLVSYHISFSSGTSLWAPRLPSSHPLYKIRTLLRVSDYKSRINNLGEKKLRRKGKR